MTLPGLLPSGWKAVIPYDRVAPRFNLIQQNGGNILEISGNGSENCVGSIHYPIGLEAGKTYSMEVIFTKTEDLDPQRHLLFAFISDQWGLFNNGVFRF